MKRMLLILLILSVVLIFPSCGKASATVISSDGKSYELVLDENGKQASDSAGNIIVAGQDENGSSVTEVLTEKYLIIDDNTLKTPSYDYEIPDDFELKSTGADPLLENSQGTIQFNIMDKTDTVSDFDEYVTDTYNAAVEAGIAESEIENIKISDISMQRFEISMQDDEGTQLAAYAYLAEVNERVLMITVTAKNDGLTDVSQADEFVSGIDFVNQ